jgi:hypothetical protein
MSQTQTGPHPPAPPADDDPLAHLDSRPVIAELEKSGAIKIVACFYDLSTGVVEFLAEGDRPRRVSRCHASVDQPEWDAWGDFALGAAVAYGGLSRSWGIGRSAETAIQAGRRRPPSVKAAKHRGYNLFSIALSRQSRSPIG